MPDIFSRQVRSRVMASIRSKGNSRTELRLVNIFRRNRFTGWRRHRKVLGNPDFVFFEVRLAIFVDGCFWHGCPTHYRRQPGTQTSGTSNAHYWLPKFKRTRRRDRLNAIRLRRMGWTILRLWEHELASEEQVMRKCRNARVTAEQCQAVALKRLAAIQSAMKSDRARPKSAAKTR